jgi:uncharacterized membrane protein YccC
LSAESAQSVVRDWLYPILLAIVGPVSALIATYLTNRSADRRHRKDLESAERKSKMELMSTTYESLLLERRESLKQINETMTRCHFTLNQYANSPPQTAKEFEEKIMGIVDKFRDDIARSVWVDKELSTSLTSCLGSFRLFEMRISGSVGEQHVSGLEVENWTWFFDSYAKAKEDLRQALGVPKVESYLKALYNESDIKEGPV